MFVGIITLIGAGVGALIGAGIKNTGLGQKMDDALEAAKDTVVELIRKER